MEKIIIKIGKVILNVIYFFMKLLPTKHKVVMLSRQTNNENLDFKLLEKELRKKDKNIEIKILCKQIKDNLLGKIRYCFYILKCMANLANSKICIIDGYSIPVSLLKHKKDLKVIQIWHASGALKKFGYQSLNKKEGRKEEIAKLMNMHKNYTYVISPSKATAEFYKEAFNVTDKQIVINGMPRLDYVLKEDINKKEEFFKDYPEYKNKKTILYVPTFRKETDMSENLEQMIQRVDKEKYNLIIQLHPLDRNTETEKYSVDSKYSTQDLLRIADYIITDYSALAFETSILDKPLFFYVFDIEEYEETRGLNIDLFKEMQYATSKDIEEIIEKIEKEDYDYKSLERFKIKYMGTDYHHNTEKLVNFINKIM